MLEVAVGIRVWYQVRDIEAARAFYTHELGFEETYLDREGRWARLRHGNMEVGLAEGEPADAGVATLDVGDIAAEAERLRTDGVEVGVVLELRGEMRLLDVDDPDGHRIQLTQELRQPG